MLIPNQGNNFFKKSDYISFFQKGRKANTTFSKENLFLCKVNITFVVSLKKTYQYENKLSASDLFQENRLDSVFPDTCHGLDLPVKQFRLGQLAKGSRIFFLSRKNYF